MRAEQAVPSLRPAPQGWGSTKGRTSGTAGPAPRGAGLGWEPRVSDGRRVPWHRLRLGKVLGTSRALVA